MSLNHYSPNPSSSTHKAFFSSHILIPTSAATFWDAAAGGAMFCSHSFNLNNEDEEESMEDQAAANDITATEFEQEKLFEKPLTPSDVGKLNRLVIPKQHAEKHFPLNGGDSGDNGLLLGFEDEVGKPWRFRYSYWNSSQSYVLTKGWSRFVKEKRLDAGDIVLFGRHRKDVGRLFIGWRRRNSGGGPDGGAAQSPVGGVVYPGHPYLSQHEGPSSVFYQPESSNAEKQTRTRSGKSKRRVRLFGVDLESADEESEPLTPEDSAGSSQVGQHQPYQYYSDRHRTW